MLSGTPKTYKTTPILRFGSHFSFFFRFNKPFFRKYHPLNALCLEQWDCPDRQEIHLMYRCVISSMKTSIICHEGHFFIIRGKL